MDSGFVPRDATDVKPADPEGTASLGADVSTPGPGQTAESVLSWVIRRAARSEWSLLRPAAELVAQVHPDDPVLREYVLSQARSRLVSRATQPLGAPEQRAVATLTVAINLSRQQGDRSPGTDKQGGTLKPSSLTGRTATHGQRPTIRGPYPADPSYFMG